jgi:sugar (Glycoside-Pentoside-Hexuronide) transporter
LTIALLIVLVTIAAFYNIDADTSTKVMYAGITYILWGTLYTISDVPFWSMSSVMTDEPQERAKAATCAMLGVNAGIGATLIVFPKLSNYFADGRADQGYLPAVIVLMLVGLVFMFNGFYNTKERISTQNCEKVTLKETFQAVRKNKPLFFILAAFFMNIFFNLVNGLYIFFFTYNMNDKSLVSLIGTITLVSALACLATPVLTKRFKKRNIFIALCVLEIITRIGFYLTGYDNPTVVMTWLAVATGIFMMTNPLVSAMIADTVEYSYYHSGKRTAAITFSGQTFTGKLSVAVAGGLTGIILTGIGYVPNAVQTETALSGMFFCIALLPALGALVRIFIMSRYTFTEDQHAILREKLRRGEFAEGVDASSIKPNEELG